MNLVFNRIREVKATTNFVDSHQLFCGIRLVFVQGHELDSLWRSSLVTEGGCQGVKIVSADGYQLSSPAEILVQLVLKVDERFIGALGEFDVP